MIVKRAGQHVYLPAAMSRIDVPSKPRRAISSAAFFKTSSRLFLRRVRAFMG